jgi:hypothetical protein
MASFYKIGSLASSATLGELYVAATAALLSGVPLAIGNSANRRALLRGTMTVSFNAMPGDMSGSAALVPATFGGGSEKALAAPELEGRTAVI